MENTTVIEQAVAELTRLRESAAKAPMTLAEHERDSAGYKELKRFIEGIELTADPAAAPAQPNRSQND